MTSENSTTSHNPWALTPELIVKAREIGRETIAIEKNIKKTTAKCDIHKSIGKFLTVRGAFTRARPVYWCEKGEHEFFNSSNG